MYLYYFAFSISGLTMAIFNLFRITAFTFSIFLSYFFAHTLKEMSLEEKVGQLLMVHFHGEEVNEDAITLVQKLHVGGIIYYSWANGLNSSEKVYHLSESLQKLAKQNRIPLPLFIALDQEGGVLSRLSQDFTAFPGNRALAMTGNEKLAELSAFAIGEELCAVGINMNLSPVVDINNNPRNPVIGVRSFGDTADIVVSFADHALRGFRESGIVTSLKHFPGHGDVEIDTHEDLPILHKTLEQLEKMELIPFSNLANQADTVVTAHIIVSAFDDQNCVTLSKSSLDYLRETIGFKGVILTDSLIMEGLLKNCASIDEAAIRAINAGCDILLLGGKQMNGADQKEITVADVQRIHTSLVNAVRDGRISEERLNQALERILDLKNRYALYKPHEKEKSDLPVKVAEHQLLAQKIASHALRIHKNRPIPSLEHCHLALFAPAIVQRDIEKSSLFYLGEDTRTLYFKDLNPSEEELQSSEKLAKEADVLIFCSYNAWRNTAQANLIKSLMLYSKPVILICLRDPLDRELFPEVDFTLTTFSPTFHSIQAAADALSNPDNVDLTALPDF